MHVITLIACIVADFILPNFNETILVSLPRNDHLHLPSVFINEAVHHYTVS